MAKIKDNKKVVVKIICLLLSFGLWLYVTNVENPVRSYDIKNVPVELINTDSVKDSNFSIVDGQKFTVDLNIEGSSIDLSKAKPQDFKVVADMSSYVLKDGDNYIPVEIKNYPANVTIKNSVSLAVKVNLEEIITKEFMIKSNVKVNYKENIHLVDQSISPQTVKVTGGKSIVDNISSAVISGEAKDVGENINKSYEIKFLDSQGNEITGVDSDINSAKLSLKVNNGKTVPINLKTTGSTPQGYLLTEKELSKSSVSISGTSDALSKIDAIETEPIDLSSITEDKEGEVKLIVPDGIKISDATIKVKFTVKKEETAVKNIQCNVNYDNLNSNLTLESSTSSVQVSLSGEKNLMDTIGSDNINVSLDLTNVKEEGTYTYKPTVTLNSSGNDITVTSVGDVTVVVKNKS